MRYRKLVNGDYSFGQQDQFFIDQPEAVAQAVSTQLQLIQGSWFLDNTAGVPYFTRVLGENTMNTYAITIQEAILNTPGVRDLSSFNSFVDVTTRKAYVYCMIDTIYGTTPFTFGDRL